MEKTFWEKGWNRTMFNVKMFKSVEINAKIRRVKVYKLPASHGCSLKAGVCNSKKSYPRIVTCAHPNNFHQCILQLWFFFLQEFALVQLVSGRLIHYISVSLLEKSRVWNFLHSVIFQIRTEFTGLPAMTII